MLSSRSIVFKILLATSFLFFSFYNKSANGQDINLLEKLIERNEQFVAMGTVRPYLFDLTVISRLQTWLQHPQNNKYIIECQFQMRPFFMSEKIIGPLCYFLRQDSSSMRAKYFDFLKVYYFELRAALGELIYDPRYSQTDRNKAKKYYDLFQVSKIEKFRVCFGPALKVKYPADGNIVYSPFQAIGACLREQFEVVGGKPFFAIDITKEFPNHPGHAISPVGWIPGNLVTYLTYNDVSQAIVDKVQEKINLVKDNYPLSGAGSFEEMLRKDPFAVFTEAEGFYSIENDPIWAQRGDAIFPVVKRAMDGARESVFIDEFFFGGVMGASMAKYLVTLAERGVKIFVIADNYNHYGYKDSMRPIFNYLQAYAYNHPERMVVSGSYIKARPTGLPKFFDSVVTDEMIAQTGLGDYLPLYGRAQADHSKVVVIDGTGPHPVAFVGSKNWLDQSGAYCYDDVAKIEGPAAAAVLDDFYFDMMMALRYELDRKILNQYASNGWSKELYRSGQSVDEMTANVIKPFDLLNRDAGMNPSNPSPLKTLSYGPTWLRTGYNNVDATKTGAVDQVLQTIFFAGKNIFIRDQLLNDRNVILALINARKSNPSLDVRVILDPVENSVVPALPNLLYLDVMAAAGIQVKWKKAIQNEHVHQELHMKTISADGRCIVSGSANKDQLTMYGSFREEQIDTCDEQVTKVHDKAFLEQWSSPQETSEVFSTYDFQVPLNMKNLNGEPMTEEEFISLLRNLASIFYDATIL